MITPKGKVHIGVIKPAACIEAGAFAGSRAVVALPLGVRWNPMKGNLRSRAIKPYLAVGFGPVIGSSQGASTNFTSAFAGTQSAATAGGHFGVGVDVLTGRSWSIGVSAGYNWMADLSKPIGGRDNYSGFQAAVSFAGYSGRAMEGATDSSRLPGPDINGHTLTGQQLPVDGSELGGARHYLLPAR